MAGFLRVLAVCHTVVIDVDKKGNEQMQASSPDELALVEGAASIGVKFSKKTTEYIEIEVLGSGTERYEVLMEFPFDSTRKRMSLIVKDCTQGRYLLMTKGADSIILPRCSENSLQPQELSVVHKHLHYFACQGYRTLVIA